MRFIAFIGSPRADGTTRFIVDKLLAGAQAAGAETKSYLLNELEFRGCQGCRKCKQEGVCDQKDDLSPLYAEIMASDVLVVSSPVYMAYLTGQTKLFLDRLYAFTGPDQVSRVPHGKKCVLVLTQGYHDTTAYQALIKNVSSLLTRLGFEVVEPFVVGGVNTPTDPAAQEGGEAAFELGKKLVADAF